MRHTETLADLELSDLNPITLGFESCKPKHSYGPAVRSYWLLHYVVSGKGHFTRNGQTHQITKESMFIIPPYLETYYEADSSEPWTYIWIGFTAKNNLPTAFSSPAVYCPEAEHIFKEMKFCSKKTNGKTEFLLAKLWELFSLFSDDGNALTGYVETALRYMKSEYMNPISISEIAARLSLDRSYFSNLFKNEMGISPGKYLTQIRLSNAAELLTKHAMSPSIAALSCGFSDIYHFSKAFKKHYGQSPREYIKLHKKTNSGNVPKSEEL